MNPFGTACRGIGAGSYERNGPDGLDDCSILVVRAQPPRGHPGQEAGLLGREQVSKPVQRSRPIRHQRRKEVGGEGRVQTEHRLRPISLASRCLSRRCSAIL